MATANGFDESRPKDLLLINSPLMSYPPGRPAKKNIVSPLGLGSIATCCSNAGYNAGLLDAEIQQLPVSEIVDYIAASRPKVVGINCLSPNFNIVLEIVHKIPKGPMVLLGGPHATLMPHLVMKGSHRIDFVLRGEAEESIVELLLELNGSWDFEKIEGLSYRRGGRIIHNPNRKLIENLDSLPFIDRKFFSNDPKTEGSRTEAAIITSRGCCFSCAFCSEPILNQNRIRKRSVENIIEEIKMLRREHGVNYFHFMDDHFTINKAETAKFCRLLGRNGLAIKWRALSRVDSVDKRTLKLMKAAGCDKLGFGIESCSDKVLKKIGKGISFRQVRRTISLCKSLGIKTKGFFTIGYPFEAESEIDFTIAKSRELGLDSANFSIVRAFPGTRLFEEQLRHFSISDLIEYDQFDKVLESPVEGLGVDVEKLVLYNVSNRRNISTLGLERLKEKLGTAIVSFYSGRGGGSVA